MLRVDEIDIHHAASSNSARMEDLRRHHVQVLGWKDIGYHYVIERDGTLRVGRPAHQVGAHVGRFNWNPWKRTYPLGVCLVGNAENEPITPAQRRTLVQLLAVLCVRHKLKVSDIRGHRDVMPGLTLCPGRYLYADLPAIRREVLPYTQRSKAA